MARDEATRYGTEQPYPGAPPRQVVIPSEENAPSLGRWGLGVTLFAVLMLFVTDGIGDIAVDGVMTLLLLVSAIGLGIASLATRERPRWWAVVTLFAAPTVLLVVIFLWLTMMAVSAGISQW